MKQTRREALKMVLGAGFGLGLRSLATGLPPLFFTNPRLAFAQEAKRVEAAALTPQFLILSTSGSGDPMNANVPGCYLDANIAHPTSSTMAPASMSVGGVSYQAAKPWTTMSAGTLSRTMFLHHSTNTVVHPDEGQVLQLRGAVSDNDNLLSFVGANMQNSLSTLQGAPIVLGAGNSSEYVPYQGRPQAPMTPTSLSTVLGDPNGPLTSLQAARDTDLNALTAWMRANSNAAQAALIDRYVNSRTQVREISETMLTQLSGVTNNLIASQLTSAIILAQMKLAPVFTVHLPFGGDNHVDTNLAGEAAAHVSAVAVINTFLGQLATTGMQDQITFATLNVFGRQLNKAQFSNGRGHQANHHVMLAIGPHVKGGVYGGVQPYAGDYAAMALDSQSGAANASGDITLSGGLASAGRTLCAAVGLDDATLAAGIPSGTTIQGAIAAA